MKFLQTLAGTSCAACVVHGHSGMAVSAHADAPVHRSVTVIMDRLYASRNCTKSGDGTNNVHEMVNGHELLQ